MPSACDYREQVPHDNPSAEEVEAGKRSVLDADDSDAPNQAIESYTQSLQTDAIRRS